MKYPLHSVFAACVVSAAVTLASTAQPYPGDLLVIETPGTLLRVPQAAAPATIFTNLNGSMWSCEVDVGNQDAIVATTTGDLMRVQLATGVATTVISGLGATFGAKLDQNGDYLAGTYTPFNATSLFRVKRDGSSVTTLGTFTAAPLFTKDLSTGGWLVGHASGQIERRSLDFSTVVGTIPHASVWTYAIEHDPWLPRVYVAATALLSIDTASQTVTTLDPAGPGAGVALRGLAVDRAPGQNGGLILASTATTATVSPLMHFDRAGRNVGTLFTTSVGKIAYVTHDESRNLASLLTRAPNNRTVHVSFPLQAGKPYIVAFGFSGFSPGIGLPDGRVVPIVPDSLLTLTAAQSLPPLLANNIGVLDASGAAQVTLNLNVLPVSGLPLWAVAVAIDPAAPFGVAEISKPMLIVL